MSKRTNKLFLIASAITFIWVGFVCAISFMEAWLKFQAPGITVPLGLGIGRLVFSALNKVESFLSLVILITFFMSTKQKFWLLFFVAFIILLLQTIWLLPALDLRALRLLDGQVLEKSYLHIFYIIVELVKVICLLFFGVKLMQSSLKDNHTFVA